MRDASVLLLAGSAHPLGGVATWLDHLMAGLKKRAWRPVLGLVEGARYHRPLKYLEAHPHQETVIVRCTTGTREGRLRAVLEAIRSVRPDVLVSMNISDAYRGTAQYRREGGEIRLVTAIHGFTPGLFDDLERYRNVLDGVAATNRLVCHLAVTHSRVPDTRVFYTPCGTTFSMPRGPRPTQNPLVIGYAGRLEDIDKRVLDLPVMSEALEKLGTPHRFLVAGVGSCRSELDDQFGDGRAEYLGFVEREHLQERFYDRIDVLVVPSACETGPLVAWEAMASGVPVVLSRFIGSGLEGFFTHGVNALQFEVGDVESAAVEITRLADDPSLKSRLVERGLEDLRDRYDSSSAIDDWDRCLRNVLDRPQQGADDVELSAMEGRLDRWMGRSMAESIRRFLGRRGVDAGPGGEWPHTQGTRTRREAFLRLAAQADDPGSGSG